MENILLRQTNTRMIYEYKGRVVQLDQPKEITRGDPPRTIVYSKKPSVTFLRKFVYTGAEEADKQDAAAEEAAALEKKSRTRRQRSSKKKDEEEAAAAAEEETAQ